MNAWAFNNILGYGGNYGKQNEGYNAYSFLRRGTEIQNNIKPTIAGIPLSMSTAEQQTEMSRQFGNSRTNGDEQSIYGATLQVPGGKNPMELDDNGFFEQVSGDHPPHSTQYRFKNNLFDQSAGRAMVGGGTQYKEQEPQDWRLNGDFGSGEQFVTERSLDGSQAGYETLYDVLQEFGGWQGVKSAVGDKMDAAFSIAGSFASEWGEAYGETLLKKCHSHHILKLQLQSAF